MSAGLGDELDERPVNVLGRKASQSVCLAVQAFVVVVTNISVQLTLM
jgi:hypothetical protein